MTIGARRLSTLGDGQAKLPTEARFRPSGLRREARDTWTPFSVTVRCQGRSR